MSKPKLHEKIGLGAIVLLRSRTLWGMRHVTALSSFKETKISLTNISLLDWKKKHDCVWGGVRGECGEECVWVTSEYMYLQKPEDDVRSPQTGVVLVSCLLWVLRAELGFFRKAESALNYWAISPAPHLILIFSNKCLLWSIYEELYYEEFNSRKLHDVKWKNKITCNCTLSHWV